MAFGGHLSLTSSAVTAIGKPFSDGVILEGCVGAVPGMAADWILSVIDWSIPLIKGFTSACWSSLLSCWGVTVKEMS